MIFCQEADILCETSIKISFDIIILRFYLNKLLNCRVTLQIGNSNEPCECTEGARKQFEILILESRILCQLTF